MSCSVGHKHGSNLALWHRQVTTAPIQPLAWEPSYATGAALKRPKKKEFRFPTSHIPAQDVHIMHSKQFSRELLVIC